ncbi:MAG: BRCT domain-containing protein [Desulfobulbaceae bacterium]|nr:BRCT domain-containing protein [Desulfobulbaceae bacterium]
MSQYTDGYRLLLKRHYNHKRLNDRSIDELIGISKGIIADNIVNIEEAQFLVEWMSSNKNHFLNPVAAILYERIKDMLSDDKLDEDEKDELFSVLKMFAGDKTESRSTNLSTSLPIDIPAPFVNFDGTSFCLTGKFAYGPRNVVVDAIENLGGFFHSSVRHDTNYLVIGFFASRSWAHSSYGRKIEEAIENKRCGSSISIITEDHWADFAFRNGDDK